MGIMSKSSNLKFETEFNVTKNGWLNVHNVRFGIDKILDRAPNNVTLCCIWKKETENAFVVENQVTRKVFNEATRLFDDVHKSRFDDKEYPLKLIIVYNLAGVHFEVAVINMTDRNTANKIIIYNHYDGDYNLLKRVIFEQLLIKIPEKPDRTYQHDNPDVLGTIDGRCGDVAIEIVDLEARGKLAQYSDLLEDLEQSELKAIWDAADFDSKKQLKTQIFDFLRYRNFERGYAIELEESKVYPSSIESSLSQILANYKMSRDPYRDDDDSSDDEEVGKSISSYDLAKSIESFWLSLAKNASESFEVDINKKRRYYPSFLMHAVGIGILYSQEVNDKYYKDGLKSKYLGDAAKEGGLRAILLRSAKFLAKKSCSLFGLEISAAEQLELYQNIERSLSGVDVGINEISQVLAIAIKNIVIDKLMQVCADDYLSSKNEYRKFSEKKSCKFDKDTLSWQIEENSYGKLMKLIYHFDGSREKIVGQTYLASSDMGYRCYKEGDKYQEYSEPKKDSARLGFILVDGEFLRLLKASLLKIITPILLQKKLITVNVAGSAKKSAYKTVSAGEWSSVSKELEKLGFKKTGVILAQRKVVKDSTDFYSLIGDDILLNYLSDMLKQQKLLDNFLQYLIQNQIAVRKTLPHKFSTDPMANVVDFLANIRLSNRSKTREIKNIADSGVRTDFLDTDLLSRIKRSWLFAGGLFAEEEQLISSTTLARDAQVIMLGNRGEGSYSSLSKTMGLLVANFNKKYPDKKLTDIVIAQLIRKMLNSEELKTEDLNLESDPEISPLDRNKIRQFITDFTYLLFGCEVARNPASLLSHQMMLDLIINGLLEWKNCISNQQPEMPMAMEGAVKGSRALHSKFAEHMPWRYKYEGDGDIKLMNQLIEANNKIFTKWCRMKKTYYAKDIKDAMAKSCKEWYGVDVKSITGESESLERISVVRPELVAKPKDAHKLAPTQHVQQKN